MCAEWFTEHPKDKVGEVGRRGLFYLRRRFHNEPSKVSVH